MVDSRGERSSKSTVGTALSDKSRRSPSPEEVRTELPRRVRAVLYERSRIVKREEIEASASKR
ncbi:hypothetical protein BRD01_06840 [Halobacteriales archaeon QS_8_65_32]|nr:MAG: hypothetical protein BRD01_06840 [Halobacteriales archaeon QS_8_65_32]